MCQISSKQSSIACEWPSRNVPVLEEALSAAMFTYLQHTNSRTAHQSGGTPRHQNMMRWITFSVTYYCFKILWARGKMHSNVNLLGLLNGQYSVFFLSRTAHFSLKWFSFIHFCVRQRYNHWCFGHPKKDTHICLTNTNLLFLQVLISLL